MRRSLLTLALELPPVSRRGRSLWLEALQPRLAPSADPLTFHNDVASTGANLAEVDLTPANVRVGSFGKISSTPLDGQVDAQPLLVHGVSISAGPYQGTHDVVLVATEHDSLYAIEATNPALR